MSSTVVLPYAKTYSATCPGVSGFEERHNFRTTDESNAGKEFYCPRCRAYLDSKSLGIKVPEPQPIQETTPPPRFSRFTIEELLQEI